MWVVACEINIKTYFLKSLHFGYSKNSGMDQVTETELFGLQECQKPLSAKNVIASGVHFEYARKISKMKTYVFVQSQDLLACL